MIRVVFFATPQVAVNSLMKLLNFSDIHVVAVVTQPDKPAGRGKKITEPPIKTCAKSCGIPVFQPVSIKNDPDVISKLKELQPDFFVTFAFGQILSQEVLDIPKYATVNLHASLLPKYRGANPIQRAIINGDKVTGITTMTTVLELDAGDICLAEKIDITENMTTSDLCEIISEKSPFLLYKTLKGLYTKTLVPQPQNPELVSFANKFQCEEYIINWNDTSETIHNQVRAFNSCCCAVSKWNDKYVKIVETRLNGEFLVSSLTPSQIISVTKEGIIVKTGNGAILVTKVKPENKPVLNAYDWSNGARIKIGESFNMGIQV